MSAAGAGAAAISLLSGSLAHADPVVTVNSLGDPATPSATIQAHETLADAIAYINANAGGTIAFKSSLSGTIKLKHPLPQITASTIIDGPGANRLTIDGGGPAVGSAILRFGPGLAFAEVDGLTLTHAESSDGALYSQSNLDATGVVVRDNKGGERGGIYVAGGGLRLVRSTVSGNTGNDGSGVVVNGLSGSEATIQQSTISGNTATDGYGAIDIIGATTLNLYDSTVADNVAKRNGGGIYIEGTASIYNSTIVGNRTTAGPGGGIFQRSNSAVTDIFSTILAGNRSPGHPGPDLYTNVNPSLHFSLIGIGNDTGTAITSNHTDIVGTKARPAKAKLGRLANNGGPTKTMLPALDSPVINHGSGFDLGSDQRGYSRDVALPDHRFVKGGNGVDIGAVEVQLGAKTFTGGSHGAALSMTVGPGGCLSSFNDLPVRFHARLARGIKWDSVAFYLDPRTRRGQRPVARSKRKSVSPTLPLATLASGIHTVRAIGTYSRKHHRSTVTLNAPFSICTLNIV